jgi:hypothetical protein
MRTYRMAVASVTLLFGGAFASQGCMKDALEVGDNPPAAGMGGMDGSAARAPAAGAGGGTVLGGSGPGASGTGGASATGGSSAAGGDSGGSEVIATAGAGDSGMDCGTLTAEHTSEYEEATTCDPNSPVDECGATYKLLIDDQCTIAVNAGATDAVSRLHDLELAIREQHCPQGTLGTCAPGTTGHCGSMGRCLLDLAN